MDNSFSNTSLIQRNTHSVYNNEKATHIIQKIMLSNMRDSRGFYISKLYDLTKFYDQDFQEIQEIQDTVESKIFFTNQCSKRLFINIIDSLGVTGKKYPLKQSDEPIKVEISLHQAAPHNLGITIIGHSFGEFVYEVRTEGNIINLFEYKIVKDTRDKKLDELAYSYRQSRTRKLMALDRDIVRLI